MTERFEVLLVVAPFLVVLLVVGVYAADTAWQSFSLWRRRHTALQSFYNRKN